MKVFAGHGGVRNKQEGVVVRLDDFVPGGGFDDDLIWNFHRGSEVHQGGVNADKGAAFFEKGRGLAKISCGWMDDFRASGLGEDALVVRLLLGPAEKENGQIRQSPVQLLDQLDIRFQRPASEGEIFGAARPNVQAEEFSSAKPIRRNELFRPVQFRCGKIDFVIVSWQFGLRSDE